MSRFGVVRANIDEYLDKREDYQSVGDIERIVALAESFGESLFSFSQYPYFSDNWEEYGVYDVKKLLWKEEEYLVNTTDHTYGLYFNSLEAIVYRNDIPLSIIYLAESNFVEAMREQFGKKVKPNHRQITSPAQIPIPPFRKITND